MQILTNSYTVVQHIQFKTVQQNDKNRRTTDGSLSPRAYRIIFIMQLALARNCQYIGHTGCNAVLAGWNAVQLCITYDFDWFAWITFDQSTIRIRRTFLGKAIVQLGKNFRWGASWHTLSALKNRGHMAPLSGSSVLFCDGTFIFYRMWLKMLNRVTPITAAFSLVWQKQTWLTRQK